jgi:hypothetical protein
MPWGRVLHLTGHSSHLNWVFPWSFFVVTLLSFAAANVEKTIFLGPSAVEIPRQNPNLDNLFLIPLAPSHASVRTRLNASFPTKETPQGTEHWLLLEDLTPNARYEVRICWLATVRLRPRMILEATLISTATHIVFFTHIHTHSSFRHA